MNDNFEPRPDYELARALYEEITNRNNWHEIDAIYRHSWFQLTDRILNKLRQKDIHVVFGDEINGG